MTAPVESGASHPGELAEPYEFAGVPDAFQRLWTPHRMVYIGGEGKPQSDAEHHCPFCEIPSRSDDDGLIVARGELVFAVLNLYPYNPGHLMTVPYRHIADFTELTPDEGAELSLFVQQSMIALRAAANPMGFNIGINQGVVGGAGIAAHLHQHVVPRWGGDMNFMPIVGHTRVLPQLLHETRALIAEAWPATR
ncbi:HIT domain-containing protein [Jatrophihabitans telluris]|uniref:HIT domain-containing protein n=1 Tax=Jatrophihabitans telluris TaxID=2038343 RepID=A0ABY4QV07_9ACTN|nr:HIT domain-containing protein [Jatrophihabitans telluris]UQX86820.1 HIT domain-containing protein [Jatrophihabitans telluris]